MLPPPRLPISALRRPEPIRPRRSWSGLRWDLLAALLVTVGPLLFVAAWAHRRLQTADLEERLVTAANATFGLPRPRPIHRLPATAGSEAERMAQALPRVRVVTARLGSAGAAESKRLAAGDAPLAAMSPALAAALDELRAPLGQILDGTRAARAELPAPILQYADETATADLQEVTRFSAILARRELAAGRPRAAAAWCVDGLALARDLAVAVPGLVWQMVAAAQVKSLTPSCAAAIDAAPGADRSALIAELRSLRGSFPSFAEVMRAEGLSLELALLGSHDDGRIAGRLTPVARALVQHPKAPNNFLQRMYARDAWRPLRIVSDELIAASMIDDELDRDLAIERVHEDTARWSNLLVPISIVNTTRYARRNDGAMRRLGALVLLAGTLEHRARAGRWPAGIRALADADLLLPAEARRLGGAELTAPLEGPGLELRVPMPGWDDEPAELVLTATTR
jgi:hypothetical protein